MAEYLQQLRLERASTLLKETEASVISIAQECGFASVSYFNRIFKAAYGITPSEYRKQHSAARESGFAPRS